MYIKKGTCVEVPRRGEEHFCWQFLHVQAIYKNSGDSNVTIRGIRLTRTRYLGGRLRKLKNEVCALYDVNEEDTRTEDAQAAVDISAAEMIRTRELRRTNNSFPSHRYNPSEWQSEEKIENNATLVQRYKQYRFWPTARAMATKRSYSGCVKRLRSSEIHHPDPKVIDDKLRNEFRGGVVRGGSFKGGDFTAPMVNLDEDDSHEVTIGYQQQYTADDIFCGGGGASRGIRQAGFRLNLACDMDDAACRTYHENFPEATLYPINVFELIKRRSGSRALSDLVHFSPPCQVFSPAHTRTGKDDEANVAALYALGEFLKIERPRISTGEQTFGLLFDRNEECFNALVGQYTDLGYSFSWKILQFKEYGVPSIRRRLVWIASCPGEKLPPFPKPTHAETGNGRLPAFVTLHNVLGKVKANVGHSDHLHQVASMLQKAEKYNKSWKPYDDRCQIGTITTSGTEWGHPSGKRSFTSRELASIQTFPTTHKFLGTTTQVNRQIGNAFPPIVVGVLYRHLREWLLRQDWVVVRSENIVDLTQSKSHPITIDLTGNKGKPHYYNNQAPAVSCTQNPMGYIRDTIEIDDSDDEMIDLTDVVGEEGLTFSRESSRTLSPDPINRGDNTARVTGEDLTLERLKRRAEACLRDELGVHKRFRGERN
ncbi:S-adenosyl-L-methionine-dependent methyltransferase [Astrocystis sublimbata]|nr:S-adenosyl-L-methionine-dependent methyltransferase [Astrocystis sublimbata]